MNENIKVLISFGAAGGGFELAWSLKQDLDAVLGEESTYLDALSLSEDPYTSYTWDEQLGIWKMSNEHWFGQYVDAMFKSKVMIFIVTKEWLESYYCWEEYTLFLQSKNITPIFLIDNEVMQQLNQDKEPKVLKNDREGELYQHRESFKDYVEKSFFLLLERTGEPSDYVWEINENIRYEYHNKYCLSQEQTEALKSAVMDVIFE